MHVQSLDCRAGVVEGLNLPRTLLPVRLCCNDTRTIAEAEAQGYSHVRAPCPACQRVTDIPWKLSLRRPGSGVPTMREH
jgi:hypothetical protein